MDAARPASPSYLFICTGPTCGERGGKDLLRACKEHLVDRGSWNACRTVPVHCFGECGTGPNACAWPEGAFQTGIDPRTASALVDEVLAQRSGLPASDGPFDGSSG